MTYGFRSLLAIIALGAAVALPGATISAGAIDASDRAEIETIVREYLLENPEILLEVQQALEERQAVAQREQRIDAIASRKEAIFEDKNDPVLGNPEGNITIVEFFDYNCGFCKRAMNDMITMIENDDELRFVLKEFPILGPDSEGAHRVAFAFNDLMPENYGEFHLRLLGFDGRATEDVAMRIATELGADEAAIRKQMAAGGIPARVRNTYDLANVLGINGTPAYVVGDEVVAGALGESVLTAKIANVRQCGSTLC
ncbi:DsbA family protein [Oricola cellulosilytica]|uniref:DsbA family protein n=1 Tax=Oricola cellulosilytica TaxID=1429082 RepID=A0A4R0PDK8_9HYPH|nr:DsbA family protein [Oricola cellulosilytica]TCD14508.1 DsbA family protein [Oricola cellulosilytica]